MFLSREEINEKYNGQWVYAVDCEESDAGTILGGKVVLHSRNRDDVIRAMPEYEKKVDTLTYFRYAGNTPEEISIIL